MGFFTQKKSEIETVFTSYATFRLRVFELEFKSRENYDWSETSRDWVMGFYYFAQANLESINKSWPVFKGERRILLAFNELATYFIFKTLQVGADSFLNHNKIDKETYIKEVSEILNLTEGNKLDIDTYTRKYGSDVIKKYLQAPVFTEEIGIEFSALKKAEFEELLKNIIKAIKEFDEIPLPGIEATKEIEECLSISGIGLNGIMERCNLLPSH